MVILHIASIRDTSLNGVHVAVPQHIRAQAKYAQVGLLNVLNEHIPQIGNQFPYGKGFSFRDLPAPFCKPDLIVFHEVYKPPFLKLYRQARAAGIPYVIFPHGCLTETAQRKKRVKKVVANALLFNDFIQSAEALQFLSEWERDFSNFGENKMVITHGMNVPAVKSCGSEAGKVRLVYIGRTEIYIKGLDLMLRAACEIAKQLRQQNVRLELYGPDTVGGHAKIRNIINELQIGDLVKLNGPVVGKKKEDILLATDIFIQTSRSDGFPLGVLEAMSYGVPCLVTVGTSYGPLVSKYDTGWVAQTDVQSIASMLVTALNERDRWEEKSHNAFRMIEANFRWEKVAENTLQEYRKILAQTGRFSEGTA